MCFSIVWRRYPEQYILNGYSEWYQQRNQRKKLEGLLRNPCVISASIRLRSAMPRVVHGPLSCINGHLVTCNSAVESDIMVPYLMAAKWSLMQRSNSKV